MKHEKIWADLKDVGKNLSSDLVHQLDRVKARDRLFKEFSGAVSKDGQSCALIQMRSDYQISFYFKNASDNTVGVYMYHRPLSGNGMEVEILKTPGLSDRLIQNDGLQTAFGQALVNLRESLCYDQYALNEISDAMAHFNLN